MSRGFSTALSMRTRRSFTLFWAVLFILSLALQYGSFAAPRNVLASVADGGTHSVEVPDKTESATITTTGGAVVTYIGDSDASLGSAGTGTFEPFVRLQASPTSAATTLTGPWSSTRSRAPGPTPSR